MTVVVVDAWSRAKVSFASALTSQKDSAAAVAVNASPLLAWLEAAPGEEDMRVRPRAMRLLHLDRAGADPGGVQAAWHGCLLLRLAAPSVAHGPALVNACGPGAATPGPLVPESPLCKGSSDD